MKNYVEEELSINITPIVDVFLILLVIFATLTFSLLSYEEIKKESLKVPGSNNKGEVISKVKSSKITINSNNKVKYKGKYYSEEQFLEKVKFLKETSFDIVANKNGNYNIFFQIVSELKNRGIDTKLNLIYIGK